VILGYRGVRRGGCFGKIECDDVNVWWLFVGPPVENCYEEKSFCQSRCFCVIAREGQLI
jgi:hypothetical protein